MADAAPWIALASSLAALALSVRFLLWLAARPPAARPLDLRACLCADPILSPPANRNEPSHDARTHAGR